MLTLNIWARAPDRWGHHSHRLESPSKDVGVAAGVGQIEARAAQVMTKLPSASIATAGPLHWSGWMANALAAGVLGIHPELLARLLRDYRRQARLFTDALAALITWPAGMTIAGKSL